MDKKDMKRTPRLRKETIRTLGLRTLEPSDLTNVAGGEGGTGTRLPHYTRCCG